MKLTTILALTFATSAAGQRFLKTKKDDGLEFNSESIAINYDKSDELTSANEPGSKEPRSFDQSFEMTPLFEFIRKLLTQTGFQEEGPLEPAFDKRSEVYDDIGDPFEDADAEQTDEEPSSANVHPEPLNEFGDSKIKGFQHEKFEGRQNEFGELGASNSGILSMPTPEVSSDLDSLVEGYLSKVSVAEIEDIIQECARLETAFMAEGIKFDEIYCPANFNPVAKTKLLANEELLAKANMFQEILQSHNLDVGQVFCPPEITF